MKQSSEMLYKYICSYCKPNILINFCLENFHDADSNAFLVKDITLGVQLVKDEFYNKKENLDITKSFSSFLDAAQNNTLDMFCQKMIASLPTEYQNEFSKEVDIIFDEFNKKTCNPQSFYDIMRVYRNTEELISSKK